MHLHTTLHLLAGVSHFDKGRRKKICHHMFLLPGQNLYLITPYLKGKGSEGKKTKRGLWSLLGCYRMQDLVKHERASSESFEARISDLLSE